MNNFRSRMSYLVMKYLVVPPVPRRRRGRKAIACVGDSITFGAGVRGKRKLTWEYFLEQKLGSRWQVLNYGISGRTLVSDGDYPYTAEKMYGASHKAEAEVYLLMLGTNDSKPYNWNARRYLEELGSFADGYLALPNRPQVILMMPPCCFPQNGTDVVAFDISTETICDEVCSVVRKVAEERNLQTIDLYTFTEEHPDWFADGVHPNETGNRNIAEYLFRQLSLQN